MKKVLFIPTVVISAALCVAQTSTQPVPAAPTTPAQAAAQATPVSPATVPLAREIRGTVKAGNAPLPGVTVTAANTITGKKVATSTDLDGSYLLTLPSNGRYVVKAELAAFAPATQETVINATSPTAKLDISMQLASRVQQTDLGTQIAQAASAMGAGGRGGMQSLGLNAGDTSSFAANGGAAPGAGASADSGANASLPFNAGDSSESVSVSGQMGRTQGALSQDELEDRIAEARDRMAQQGGGQGNFQFGGPGGGGGGRPMIVIAGPAGGIGNISRFNINKPHGTIYYQAGNSIFDAKPYSLTGAGTTKSDYNQGRFGFFLGGPLVIPHIYNGGMKTLFFGGYNGSIVSNPYDAFSTVPTLAERSGDFSQAVFTSGANAGQPVQLFDPATHAPIAGNNIAGRITPQAQALLGFIPLPNLPGNTQNFHFVSSTDNDVQNANFRVIHNFGDVPNFMQALGGGRGGRGGGGGGNGRRRTSTNLNAGFNYNHVSNDIANPFPTLGGKSEISAFNASVGFNLSRGRLNNNFNASYNRNHVDTLNNFAFKQNVAGAAGVGGVSTDPFDFGVPRLSFTNFRSLSDISSADRFDQTFSVSDGIGWTKGKHSLRVGGDFRRIYNDIRSDQNARGVFTFTGFATGGIGTTGSGFDFADFLLGLPQLTSIQSGNLRYDLRGNSWDVYGQDEWRLRSNLTFNLGLRYEYVSPFSEAHNRLVNLDVAPGFTAVAPVLPGQAGAFTGTFPSTLVNPDRNNWAPRIGIAYKPFKNTVVRSGYGINYNLGQYSALAQQLAFQPPFAFTETNIASPTSSLTLANGFPVATGSTTTNNFAVNRDYKLAYVQTWNLDIQQEIHRSIVVNIGYNGSKGTDLDIVRAPNRTPTGLRIPGVQPFNFESSEGDSTLHALSVRARQRLRHGISLQGQYVFSKSIDNASSIGGGASVVAQNDLDLAAERGLSSFYQKHRFTGSYIYELPFGPSKKFLNSDSLASKIAREWQFSGNWTIATGTPFTPRVLGSFADVARGTNGTLRADVTGQPIQLANPTVLEYFNTAAFIAPPFGQFGDARRNSIMGPGTVEFDMAVSKNVTLKDFQALEFRVSATNIFNTVHFTSIDTQVNSPTFGQVIAAGAMRRMQLSARYRF